MERIEIALILVPLLRFVLQMALLAYVVAGTLVLYRHFFLQSLQNPWSDWQGAQAQMRGVSRCFTTDNGVPFVMMVGIKMMPMWFVKNLDSEMRKPLFKPQTLEKVSMFW